MRVSGYTLGGEQSGHVIMSEHATTGDGILTALHVLERMAATGRSLADLASVVTRFPQVLVNVPGVDKSRADDDPVLAAAVAEEEAALGDSGRVLLRPSGTEDLVRVMVEASTPELARDVADRLAAVVRDRLARWRNPRSRFPERRAPLASSSVGIEIRELDRLDEAQVRTFWEIERDAVADRPYNTCIAWQAAQTYHPHGVPRPDAALRVPPGTATRWSVPWPVAARSPTTCIAPTTRSPCSRNTAAGARALSCR